MARVKLAPLITSISGSIGGVTIQRNKYGISLRSKPLPPTKSTAAQQIVRKHILTIQAAWQALSDAQRLQWDRFLDFSGQTIKHNKSVKLSGHALYLKYQFLRLLSGRPLLTTITYIPMPTVKLFYRFRIAAGVLYLDFDGNVDVSEYYFVCKVTSPRHISKRFSPRGLRFMDTIYGDSGQFVITDPYISAFGVLPAVSATVHYELQWYSYLAPVYSGIITGTNLVV